MLVHIFVEPCGTGTCYPKSVYSVCADGYGISTDLSNPVYCPVGNFCCALLTGTYKAHAHTNTAIWGEGVI